MNNNQLTQAQLDKLAKINHTQITLAVIGAVGGLLYAREKGNGSIGGVWKGILYAIGGTLAVSVPSALILGYLKGTVISQDDSETEKKV